MIKRLITLVTALLTLSTIMADDVGVWREYMWHLVNEGNSHYERSYRRGILLYADSIKTELANYPCREDSLVFAADSLEFTADYLKLMGDYHYENSNYDSASYSIAEDYYRQALDIYDGNRSFSNEIKRAPMMHRELAQLYYKQGRYTEAKAEMEQAYSAYSNRKFREGSQMHLDYLDMRTFLAMCEARLGEGSSLLIDSVLTYYKKKHKDQDTREGQEKYYEALRKKGKITLLAGGSGTEALAYYKDYFTWRRNDALATLATMTAEEREDYWMRMRPFVADAYQTEDADAAFLYDITLFAKGLLLQIERLSGRGKSSAEALASLSYTWKDVQRRLRKNECAVEFIQYEKGGRQLMAALVLHSSGKPQWVAYCAPDDILSYNCNGQTCRERLSTTNGYRKNDLYNDSTLCSMLWSDEILAAVKGCTKIFFAPDGYLHQIAIEYMFPTQSAAITQPKLYRLTSTRRLMERDAVKNNSSQAALLMGGVDYDCDTRESNATNKNSISTASNDSIARNFIRGLNARFSYLKGTKKEIDSIYVARSCSADTLLIGSGATETAFRSLCSGYPVVAVATHGYFGAAQVPMGTDLKPCYTDESLSQSVIALAGCNASLSAVTTDDGNEYDGLLSAREISRCDMSRTRLAIISACQTGLGYITADGVYGMQRGLKNAGVESMIVSLWNVSDEATSLLMTTFHKCLGQGMTTNDAFNAARQSLIATAQTDSATTTTKFRFNAAKLINEKVSTTKKSADYSSPQFTNAFILIDAIE